MNCGRLCALVKVNMPKRKQPDPDPELEEPAKDTPSKRRKSKGEPEAEPRVNGIHENESPTKQDTPSRRTRKSAAENLVDVEDQDADSPTPKVNGRTLFATQSRAKDGTVTVTPSRSLKAKADISARRKSARLLAEALNDAEDEDNDLGFRDARLAREILEDQEEDEEEAEDGEADPDVDMLDTEISTPSKQATPSKRGRKPRVPKPPARSPTPEGNIPPEERYFYQNRSGPPQVSNNKFNSVRLLTHDEYLEQNSAWDDPHSSEKAFLMKLHKRSFPQWDFELAEGFGLCLYGYGSKRDLVTNFAEWLWKRSDPSPRIVVVNGYTPKLNMRSILNTLSMAMSEDQEEAAVKLTGQPEEMLDTFLSHLSTNLPPSKLYVLLNSIDAPILRPQKIQSLLSRLSSHPSVHFLCTADTPTFPTLWNSTLLDSGFRFIYHDCTTFASYEAELGNVVDEVHELLGRKRTRIGGKDGVGFVLRSLPENARNLYRLLLTEILSLLDDDNIDAHTATIPDNADLSDPENLPHTPSKKPSKSKSRPTTVDVEEIGVEYRTLYRKATEEFICSSNMNFQFLLKEFLDHQMITTRRDAITGAEVLGVPLDREEMEGVLGDLV